MLEHVEMKRAKFPAHGLVRRDEDTWKTDTDTSHSGGGQTQEALRQEEPHGLTSCNCIFERLDEGFCLKIESFGAL